MGEIQNQPFQLSFNASLKVDFQGSRVTSDGGLILVRELDERLGFGALIEQHLTDSRRGKNTQFPFADLLRQSVHSWSSIARVIVWRPSYGLATCTAPKAGKNSCCRRSNGSNKWERRSRSGATRPLPSRRFTRRWKRGA